MKMPLAMPDKTKVLENITTRRRQLFNAAVNAGQNKKSLKINRRDAVSFCFEVYGYFKALHVNETKSYFSLSV
jgi:hypothetical protein